MRLSFALVLLLPSFAQAQLTDAQKQATAKWVLACEISTGGFSLAPQPPNIDARPLPSLRATNAALKALKYLGAKVPNKQKHAAFVLSCFDSSSGSFAEPGGKPDVTITSIGIMAAAEVDVPHKKYAKAMEYLKQNAKNFEEIRIAAAAVEAWGVKECPFKLEGWLKAAATHLKAGVPDAQDGGAREVGSAVALVLRLKAPIGTQERVTLMKLLQTGQRDDGGWCKKGEKASDIGTTYRVMRAFHMLGAAPSDVKKLRAYIAARRNTDGGYATAPGGQSSMSGVYYAAIISHWLDSLEK